MRSISHNYSTIECYPLSSAEARAAQPVSVILVWLRRDTYKYDTFKPSRLTVTLAAALAGVPRRSRNLSAGSAPPSSAEARVAQPASVILV